MNTINLAEEAWVNAVLRYADHVDMSDLVDFVRQRYESGTNLPNAEAEYDAWVDCLVAEYYG